MNERFIPSWLNLGLLFLKTEKIKEASNAFEKTILTSPNNNAWIGKAILSEKLKTKDGLEKALLFFENASTLSQNHIPEADFGAGFCLLFLEQFPESETALKRYLTFRKDDPNAWNLYGLTLEK